VNLCKTRPGKGKQDVEERTFRKIVLVNDHKSEDGILTKENDPPIT
jgi:hypothetical protein